MGLARLREVNSAAADLTASGITLGTFDYISPEQARDPRNADVRSDLYSLGCTFFYMLTGRPPFPGGTVLQKLLQHQGDQPPDVRQFRPELPEGVARVLRRTLGQGPPPPLCRSGGDGRRSAGPGPRGGDPSGDGRREELDGAAATAGGRAVPAALALGGARGSLLSIVLLLEPVWSPVASQEVIAAARLGKAIGPPPCRPRREAPLARSRQARGAAGPSRGARKATCGRRTRRRPWRRTAPSRPCAPEGRPAAGPLDQPGFPAGEPADDPGQVNTWDI